MPAIAANSEHKTAKKQLKESGESQVSTSDPESRQIIVRNNITEVAYNVQTTVDSENNIPIDYKVTNTNDSKAMGNMLQRAKSILRTNEFTALYDKGFHTGSEFKIADDLGIEVMVAIPGVASQPPNPDYNVENFSYNKNDDYYVCPQGNKLTTPGTWHKTRIYYFKRYTTNKCKSCPVKDQCTKAKYGKGVQRSEYQEQINRNKERIEQNQDYYRRRQSIVEHPYGTIKRQWGFGYILTKKGKQRASADIGFMFIAYNLRRIMNIVGKNALKKYLEVLVLLISRIYRPIRFKLTPFKAINYLHKILTSYFEGCLNRLKFDQNLLNTEGF